jgi:hypothetical protein
MIDQEPWWMSPTLPDSAPVCEDTPEPFGR